MTIPPWGAAVLPAVMSLCLSCYWWVCCFFALLMVLDHRCMVLLLFSADWLLRIQYSSAHIQTMPTSAPKLLNNLLQPIRMAESIVCLKQLVCVCKLFIKIHPRNVGLNVKPYVWLCCNMYTYLIYSYLIFFKCVFFLLFMANRYPFLFASV